MSERGLPLQSTSTGKTHIFDLSVYEDYVNLRDSTTGKKLWRPIKSAPGILTHPDGSTEQTLIPPENQYDAVSGDPTKRPLSIWRGKGDPRWEKARQDTLQAARDKITRDQSKMSVIADSALSTWSGGLSSKVMNFMAGPDAGEFRAKRTEAHTWEHLAGSLGGAALLGFTPVPGLGPAVRALGGPLKGAANVTTTFEASAALSQTARGLVKGQGFLSEFGKRLVGVQAFALAAEVPISLAMVSADIVDHNKKWTAEAVLQGGLQQYKFANIIAGVTAVPLAALGAGLRTGSRKAASKAQSLLEQQRADDMQSALFARSQTAQDLPDSLMRGGIRYGSRKYLRGKGHGLGDALENQLYKWGRRITHDSGQNIVESRWGRWLLGEQGDDFIRYQATNRQAIDALVDPSLGPRKIGQSADTILANLRSVDGPRSQGMIDLANTVKKNAAMIPAARRVSEQMINEGQAFAEKVLATPYKHPVQVGPVKKYRGVSQDPRKLMQTALDQIRKSPSITQEAADAIDKGLRKNYMDALDDALNIRKGIAPGEFREALDKAIVRGYKSKKGASSSVQGYLNQIDQLEDAAVAVRQSAIKMKAIPKTGPALRSLPELERFRARLQAINGPYRGLGDPNVKVVPNNRTLERFYTKDGFFKIDTKFDSMPGAIEGMAAANSLHARLRADARPLVKAAKPGSQTEILMSQVDAVMTTKQRIKSALEYIATKGGGGRHTLAWGGVMTFREMKSLQEKQAAFVLFSDAVRSAGATPDALQEHVSNLVGNAALWDMELAVHLGDGIATGNQYLLQQLPQSDDPMIGPADYSAAEMENWLEAVGATIDPISVLFTANDGSTSSQAVEALRAVYPELYLEMVLDVAEFIEEFSSELTHAQLMGLDTFTGGALHYTDAPGPSLSLGMQGYQTTQQAASAGAVGGPEHRRMDIQQNTTAAQKVSSF